MAYLAHARDLRNLLSVAAKLRQLACETLGQSDRSLYLTAAVALEKRAAWLSTTLPEDRYDKDVGAPVWMHQPVDLLI